MDDIFAGLSLACALAWVVAAVAKAAPGTPAAVRGAATAVLNWRSYFIALFVITLFRAALYEMFWIPSASMQPSLREGEFVIVDKNDYGVRVPLLGKRINDGSDPRRGEIVVFRYPLQDDLFYIKRLIGLPGDNLVIDGNEVSIEGQDIFYVGPAPEDYTYEEGITSGLLGGILDGLTGDKRKIDSELHWERLPEGWHPILYTDSRVSPSASLRDENCRNARAGRRLTCVVPDDSYFVMGDNRHRSNDSRFWGFVPRSHLVGPAFTLAISFDSLSRSFSSLGLTAEAAPLDGHLPPAGAAAAL